MPTKTFTVNYKLKTLSGGFRYMYGVVVIETPPTDPKELEIAVWIKLIDRHPDARNIEIISIKE